jgi:hypothetical protein
VFGFESLSQGVPFGLFANAHAALAGAAPLQALN